MTMRMWLNYAEVDLTAEKIADVKLQISYAHPAKLEFSIYQRQHTVPIPYNSFVIFTDTEYGGWSTPLFEGYVAEAAPTDSNEVRYTCYDATHRAGREIYVMSDSSIWSTVIPRRVYNCKIENDLDKAFEFESDATVGEILEDLLEFAYADLALINAAPAAIFGGAAYDPADFAAMDMKPQEKVVFEGETLRSAIDRMLSYYPQYRMLFLPGVWTGLRRWRFFDLHAAPTTTLTLNDFSTGGKHVLSMDLQRSLEGRYTAVKFYGPERTTYALAQVSDLSLDEGWSSQAENIFVQYGNTLATTDVGRKWQIADEEHRRLAKLLPADVAVPIAGGFGSVGNLAYVNTRVPTLLVSWDGTTYEQVPGISIDWRQGIITAPQNIYRYNDSSATPYMLPTHVKFHFAYFDEPYTARYPSSGYAGLAYDHFAVSVEKKIYDESLVVGYEFGYPVTSAERVTQFESLAENIWKTTSDTVHTGAIVLASLDYSFVRLNRRINIAAVDADGATLTTGWESINAILTDVEYDFTNRVTTLQFSSDQLEFLQGDPSALKEMLKIKAMETIVNQSMEIRAVGQIFSTLTRITFTHRPIEDR